MDVHQAVHLSVIIPAYNEEARIGKTVRHLIEFLNSLPFRFELLIVDDGSTDATREVVASLRAPCTRLVRLPENRGKGAALRAGILEAKGDFVFLVDADLPYDLEFFSSALPLLMSDGADAVVGARDLAESQVDPSYPALRVGMGKIFSRLVNLLLPIDLFDTQCGFKGFRAHWLRKVILYTSQSDYTLDIEILLILRLWGRRISKLPVRLVRHHGSKVRIVADSLAMLRSLVCIALNRRRQNYPGSSPSRHMEWVDCGACGGHQFTVHTVIEDLSRFCKCRQCRTIFQNPRLLQQELSLIYTPSYFASNGVRLGYPDYACTLDHRRMTAKWLWTRIERQIGRSPMRVLDVGCGSGDFLKEGADRGMECWGNDICPPQEPGPYSYVPGNFESAELPEGFFDLVVFNDSFEHLPVAEPVLNRCRSLLKEGGHLVVNTPNPQSLLGKLSRGSWISLKHEHLILYPPAALRQLLERSGFETGRILSSRQYVSIDFLKPRIAAFSPVLGVLARFTPRFLTPGSFRVLTGGMIVFARYTSEPVAVNKQHQQA